MKSREVSNPLSRFAKQAVEYDPGEGPPPASVTLLEDHSRSILSHNDSPDLGFRWSANPYRGCLHACSYCLGADTRILMGDSRTRTISQLRIGAEIYGTRLEGRYRRYVRTLVEDIWTTRKAAYRITLSDGTQLTASGDHRFLTRRGWKHVLDTQVGEQRAHLTANDLLLGTGQFGEGPVQNTEYRKGYLCGVIRGDGHVARREYRRGNATRRNHVFRLALADLEAQWRAKRFLEDLRLDVHERAFAVAQSNRRAMRAISTGSRAGFELILNTIAWPSEPNEDWHRGFLAGIFDAEGCYSESLRIYNSDDAIIRHTLTAMEHLGFQTVVESKSGTNKPMFVVRLLGGLQQHLRFFHLTEPAITRKRCIAGKAVKNSPPMRVVSIEPIGEQTLYDITTGTGDFIANGVISHNCYARPTHEYLDMAAGTDFDTKIVVKPRAAELLREKFEDKKWKGEMVMFSGVTDCYQAIEAKLGLTRSMLEVCLEYRNPVSVISKSALVERDVELLAALAREASAHVNVSLAWIDAEDARAVEPWAPSPERRLKVIETLAKAGIPVGIMCAPIIPMLNDQQIPKLLERARDAGATWAGWTLLRLPGAVAQVFPERLRAAMPLSAERVLARIRETRGGTGRMNDPNFHSRFRGDGPYAQMIAAMFRTTAERLGLAPRGDRPDADTYEPEPESTFRRPAPRTGQLSLF